MANRTILFTGTLVLIFIMLVGAIPSTLFSNQSSTSSAVYSSPDVPDQFRMNEVIEGNLVSQDYKNITYPYTNPDLYLNVTDAGGNDTRIDVQWSGTQDAIYLSHYHVWWIFPYWEAFEPYPMTFNYLNGIQDDNISTVWLTCDGNNALQIKFQLTFDDDTYDNLTHAWYTGDEVSIWVGYVINATESEGSITAWGLVSRLLTFDMPDVHPAMNYLIAVPIWLGIAVSVVWILDKIVPFF